MLGAIIIEPNELPRRKQRGILKSIERPKGRGIKPRVIKDAPGDLIQVCLNRTEIKAVLLELLLSTRDWSFVVIRIYTGFAGLIFSYALYQSCIVPRLNSIIGPDYLINSKIYVGISPEHHRWAWQRSPGLRSSRSDATNIL